MAEQGVRNEPDGPREDIPAPQRERATGDIAPARRTPRPRLQDDEDASLPQSAAVFSVRWQCFLDEYGLWSDYGRIEGAKIEAAWLADQSSVMLGTADNDELWEINFIAMVQRTTWTDRRRSIRRVLITHS